MGHWNNLGFENGGFIRDKAWKGKFPAQVRVEQVGELKRIKDAAYILGKAGVALRQLASGLPGPQEPVQGKEVGEKLLVHFKEVKHG